MSLPLASLAELWRGEFATFWRAPPGYADGGAGRLARRRSSPPRRASRRRRRRRASTPRCATRLNAFQVAQGLKPDGLAGPLTLMQINRATGVAEPRLRRREVNRCPTSSMRCGGPMRNASAAACPGLHTQPMPELGDDERAAPSRALRPWHWVAIGLAAGLAAAVAWQASGPEPAVPELPAPLVPPPPTAGDAGHRACGSAAAADAEPAAPVPAVAARHRPPRRHPRRLRRSRRCGMPRRHRLSAPAKANSEAPAPTRVNSLAELPAEVRSALPPLAFGGSIYSNTPANRLLIVNGQLMHEGDALGGNATLEQIKPKAAVLNIRGQRFEVGL